MSWEVKQEQIDAFVAKENELFFNELQMKEIIDRTIPVYTNKRPNPKSGKPDCNITVIEKKNFRLIMKSKLIRAETEEERQGIIDHYKRLFEQE
jgi:hypothetical protein